MYHFFSPKSLNILSFDAEGFFLHFQVYFALHNTFCVVNYSALIIEGYIKEDKCVKVACVLCYCVMIITSSK